MATRSHIGIKNQDNSVTYIYCHWDGYPEHNGMLLCKHWDDVYFVEQLMNLGNLSCLGSEIGERQNFDQPTDSNWCLAYGRDRGEENVDYRTFSSEQDFLENFNGGEEFHYLFKDGKWYYSDYTSEFKPLEIDLIMKLLSKDEA